MNRFLTIVTSLSLILGIVTPIDSLIEYSFEETQITEKLLEKENGENSSSEQSTEMTTQESTTEISTSSTEIEETIESTMETQLEISEKQTEETFESTDTTETTESTTDPESPVVEMIRETEEESDPTVESETKNLPDDTVITMSPGLLGTIRDKDVELVDKDKITIGELKKVTMITPVSNVFGKIESLEGLQYAENLYYLSFGTIGDNDYDIDDLTPLSNLENLRRLDLPNSKVTDFRPLKKMAENIIKGVPASTTASFGVGIDIGTRINARQMNDQAFDPFINLGPIRVNPDGETWDFEMPFYSYDGSRIKTNGGDINYIGDGNTARIGSNIDNVFQINLNQEVSGLPNPHGSHPGWLKFKVTYTSELRNPTSPFMQKISLRGILTEIDRETMEEKTTDLGIVQEKYGHVGETFNTGNILFEESKPIREIFKGTIQRKASEETIHYVDKAIDNGFSYVQLNYKGINNDALKPSALYIRAADTNFTLPQVPEISGYGLIDDPPERIRTPAEGEVLDVNYVYAGVINITDPVLEQQIRKTLAIGEDQEITDYAMQNLETLEYDAGENGERIKDIRSLQYAGNLQKLVLKNQKIGSSFSLLVTQYLTKLTHLDLSKNKDQLYLGATRYLTDLNYLDVSETDIKPISASELPENLEILRMRKMKNANFDFISAERFTKLKRIDLSENPETVTNDLLTQFAQIAENGSLEYVDLSGNQLTDLSALSAVDDLGYYLAGSTSDFMNDRGWDFADQTFTASQRITAGKEAKIENMVKDKNNQNYFPKTGAVDFRIENNKIIWLLGFNEDGSLKNEKAVFQYNDYDGTNYSADLTVELNYEPLKIEIPLNLAFSNNASVENIKSKEYQIKNLSEFPIEVTLEEVEDTNENPLPLVEQVVQGTEGISLKLKIEDEEINLAGQRHNIGRLEEGNALQFVLTGDYFTKTSEEKQFAYSFQFTFKESGDSIEKAAE